jgi:ribosomal protein S18 acetylase RimI-like enzyme
MNANGDSVRFATPSDAAALAALHAESISIGFLVVLGPRFLERLYRRIATGNDSFALVSVNESGRVIGFVAVAENTGRLYRDFIRHDGLHAGLSAAPAVLRHPWKVIETLRYGVDGSSEKPGAEILATAVSADAQGRGIGGALVVAAIDELKTRGIEQAHVVTATDNVAGLRTYFQCGFQRHETVEVHRGVRQEVLVWP